MYVSFNNRSHLDVIPIQEEFSREFRGKRIFTLGNFDSDTYSAKSLGFNYPMLLNLYHFAGYDPLIPNKNSQACLELNHKASFTKYDIPIGYLRKWGVNWYILNKEPKPDSLYFHYKDILENENHLQCFADQPKRTIFHDSKANPLAYWKVTQSGDNIIVKMKTNSIQIRTNNPQNEYLVINYLFNDFFEAELNNYSKIPISESEIGQMILFIPAGENRIEIKYVNKYFGVGFTIMSIFSIGVILWIIYKRKKIIRFHNNNTNNWQKHHIIVRETGSCQKEIHQENKDRTEQK